MIPDGQYALSFSVVASVVSVPFTSKRSYVGSYWFFRAQAEETASTLQRIYLRPLRTLPCPHVGLEFREEPAAGAGKHDQGGDGPGIGLPHAVTRCDMPRCAETEDYFAPARQVTVPALSTR